MRQAGHATLAPGTLRGGDCVPGQRSAAGNVSMRNMHNRERERFALLSSTERPNTKLAVFVHGFRGNYLSTWGALPDLLRQHADAHADPETREWDFAFVGYDTRNVSTYLDIAARIFTEWAKAEEGLGPYARRYTTLALFGHSLGTLGIRQALCAWSEQPPGLRRALHSVTLFGTPLNGSLWARFAFGYPIGEALRQNNPQLRMLRAWCDSAYGRDPWCAVHLVLGQDDRVVGARYAQLIQWQGDMQTSTTAVDHSALVKPAAWNASMVVDYVVRGLR